MLLVKAFQACNQASSQVTFSGVRRQQMKFMFSEEKKFDEKKQVSFSLVKLYFEFTNPFCLPEKDIFRSVFPILCTVRERHTPFTFNRGCHVYFSIENIRFSEKNPKKSWSFQQSTTHFLLDPTRFILNILQNQNFFIIINF